MPRGEGIKPINSLFEKYKKTIKAPEGSVVKEFCEVVDDVCNITIKPEKVSYTPSTRVITLRVSGPLKQELLLHKDTLLAHMKGRLGPQNAPQDFI